MEQHNALRKLKKMRATKEVAAEVRWMVHNAVGMSLMYYSDYFGSNAEKIRHVTNALEELMLADRDSPNNWANYCDLGSAHMRLGYWRDRDARELDKALTHLKQVIDHLRPDYGFALYEIGRSYRIYKHFDLAIEWLEKALSVPEDRRDVGDQRIEREINRAKTGDASYP